MRTFSRLSLMAIALTFFLSALAVIETNAQVNQVLDLMDNHYKKLKTLRADVSMIKYDATLKVTEQSDIYEGKLLFIPLKGKEALVRIDWIKPAEEILSVANGKYIVYRPRLGQAMVGKIDKSKKQKSVNGAFAFINMSKAQLKANYNLKYIGKETVNGGTETLRLELTPKKKTSYKTADLWIDSNGMPIRAKITEINNDTTTVLLTNLLKNETIKTEVFKIVLPEKVKIIEG